MAHKIGEQIAEVRRELALRERNYPRWVSAGKMKQKDADYHMACMEDVHATLKFVQANELEIRMWLDARKEGDSP